MQKEARLTFYDEVMKIDIDEISPVQRKIRVELPAETVASEFSRAYENLRRRVRIKGFRAGKAPRGVLQGIYGDELKGQVQSQLVEESNRWTRLAAATSRVLGIGTAKA